jgi:hypothetical protein
MSVSERLIEESIAERVRTEHTFREECYDWLAFAPEFEKRFGYNLLGALHQPHGQGASDGVVGYFFGLFCSRILKGTIVSTRIELSASPFKDRFVAENNLILSELSGYNAGWEAAFDNNMRGSWPVDDGYFSFEANEHSPFKHCSETRPFNIPLEVGSCSIVKSWFHMRRSRAVARWPYDHKWIYVFAWKKESWIEYWDSLIPSTSARG